MKEYDNMPEKKTYVDVKIYSRKEIENLIDNGSVFKDCLILSFCDAGDEPVKYSDTQTEVMFCQIDDIFYDELEDENYTYEEYFPEADQIATIVKQAISEGKNIICQCEYGQSRSAGCARIITPL